MITINNEQKNKIKNLNPLTDSKFKYNEARWVNLNVNFKNQIIEFIDKEITRQDVINSYNEYFEDKSKGFMKAFLLTMVWGFAETGYGTHRTNNYISSEDNICNIEIALDFINSNNEGSLQKAFNQLKKIKGLGVSYLTKILYFATRAKGIDEYALIFDIRVAASLVKLTTPREIFEIINVGPSSKFKDYERYNILIHEIAKKNEITSEQLEMYLFNQKFE